MLDAVVEHRRRRHRRSHQKGAKLAQQQHQPQQKQKPSIELYCSNHHRRKNHWDTAIDAQPIDTIRNWTMAHRRRPPGRRKGGQRSFVRCTAIHVVTILLLTLVVNSLFHVTIVFVSATTRTWRDIELYHDGQWISSSYFPERIQDSVESFDPANDETDDDNKYADPEDETSEEGGYEQNEIDQTWSMDGVVGKDYPDDVAKGNGGMLNRPSSASNNPDMMPGQFPTRGPAAVFINPTESPTNDPLAVYAYPFESSNQPADPYRKPYPSYFNYNTGVRSELEMGTDSLSLVGIQQDQLPQYGPGYPTGVYNRDQGFFVRYENNRWADAATPDVWTEFRNPSSGGDGPWQSTLESHMMFSPENNQCADGRQQSPIDVRTSGVACIEHHQIRTRRGDFRVEGKSIERQILPSKLRLNYQRRPCADYENVVCSEPDPPHADFPNGWGGFADLLWVDFKFPAEHRIWGEEFDGEIQLYHLHPGRRRLPVVSLLMKVVDARDNGMDMAQGHNDHLQAAIDTFQDLYDDNKDQCSEDSGSITGDERRRRRKLEREERIQSTSPFKELINITASLLDSRFMNRSYMEDGSGEDEKPRTYSSMFGNNDKFQGRITRTKRTIRRSMQSASSRGVWDPYHEELMPTYWFYGYDGSLTEPPCSEIVSWFVMDKPMTISRRQLAQLKHILFTNVDPNNSCQSTSAHYMGSVARPLQETHGRQVWHCTRDDFIPDHERNSMGN